ncbi:MerR family transcriptional regulator [Mycolicibacterium sp. 120322]|uniref:MerR family transcriptional regulator n=1 Tax=Mycolicibacterium sp. 120322 TaxID=3096109 RepID=UPI003FA60F61
MSSHDASVRISDLANSLHLEAHVLRHWEDVGLLHPSRSANGYRDYDTEQATRARIIAHCRHAGLSLPVIASLLDRRWPGRAQIINEELQRLRAQERQLRLTRRFLDHVVGCRHSLMERCPSCSSYSQSR